MPSPAITRRPWTVQVATLVTVLSGLAVLVLAGLALAAGHGTFSAGIAVLLLVYGAMVLLAAWAFWRLARFARGPVVATAVLHLFVAVAAAKDAQVGWIASLVALAQVVCIVCVLLRLTTTAFARA